MRILTFVLQYRPLIRNIDLCTTMGPNMDLFEQKGPRVDKIWIYLVTQVIS